MTGDIIFALAILNVCIWTVNVVIMLRLRRHHGRVPNGMVAASLVAVMAGAVGGLLTGYAFLPESDRFIGTLPTDVTMTVAAAWRCAMVIAGLYGMAATIRVAQHKQS